MILKGITRAEALRLAKEKYGGASDLLTEDKGGMRHNDLDWWRTPLKVETFNTSRHKGALPLYLELTGYAIVDLPELTFPSCFDVNGGKMRLLPDKGFIKMCLSAQPAILIGVKPADGPSKGHLLLQLTPDGQSLLEQL